MSRAKMQMQVLSEIKKAMHKMGRSQTDLADTIGCSRVKFNRAMNGWTCFSADELFHLASIVEIRIVALKPHDENGGDDNVQST